MAKSFFKMGKDAGFDMTTQEGLDRFMLAYNLGLTKSRQEEPKPSQEEDRLAKYLPPSVPIRNETRSVGCNSPCPCESGRKYKKCCGR